MKLLLSYNNRLSEKRKMVRVLPFVLGFFVISCTKVLDIKAPVNTTNADIVYASDGNAISSLTGIYTAISGANFGSPNLISTGFITGLSSDELTLYSGIINLSLSAYYTNNLNSTTFGYETWSSLYTIIFYCNQALEGLGQSTTLTPAIKQQLTGEAKFVRAFCYFHLLNLYGGVPLVITTDYKVTSTLARSSTATIWAQIIADLKDAQMLLSSNFPDVTLLKTTTERVRPTSWAATALLARAYLYSGNNAEAETQATSVISNTTQFAIVPLANAFLKNNNEAIWQLQPTSSGQNTPDARAYIILSTGPTSVYLSSGFMNAFETGDQRKTNWTGSQTVSGTTYNYACKYKLSTTTATTINEYVTVLRLAEQYLIRAEARANLGKLTGSKSAQEDLNVIRTRAGLSGTTATTKDDLLTAILHERQVELFTEWGHRWFDLKRSGKADEVMSVVTPLKGGKWSSNWQLYPLNQLEIQQNPNLQQNPGYN